MHGGVDAHRSLVGVFACDVAVHLEKVAVALLDDRQREPLDRIREVEVNAESAGADTAALVAGFLRAARGNVARREVAVARVFALEEIIARVLRHFVRRLGAVFLALGHPHTAVVSQRLAHERELALVFTTHRNARRVDLRVAGIREERPALVGTEGAGDVAALGVRGKIENVAVAAGAEEHRIGRVAADFAGDHVADDDALGVAVHQHQIEHLGAREHLHLPGGNLRAQRLVGSEQKLLASLAACVKGSRHLRSTEGAVCEQSAVLTRQRHALGDALVDDVRADLGQAVDICLTRAEVTALDRVVEETVKRCRRRSGNFSRH